MKHAALCQTVDNQYHLYFNGRTHAIKSPPFIEQWLPILGEHGIETLWALPDTEMSRHISWNDFDRIDRDRNKVFPERPDKDVKPGFVSVRKISEEFERDYYFSFPEHTEWNAGNNGKWFLPSPYILGQTINYLTKQFKCDIAWGPGNIGMKVLRRDFERRGLKFGNTELTDQLRDTLNRSMFRPIWKRYYGLSEEQKTKKYLHGYDKRRQFLGAAQSVFLGIGKPESVNASEFDMGRTGFWKYRITDVSNSAFDGYDLPCPLDINREWASSDLLRAARYAGVEFEILEGVVWPRSAKFLETWAKEMWLHGAALGNTELYPDEIARENAEGTAKLAGNMLMGRLAKPGSKELYKPDWNLEIVHKAICNQFYSLNKWQGQYGIKPVLVSTDSFWIVSDEPDPALAIPDILAHQNEQRGYHHIGTVNMTDEIIRQFQTHSPEACSGYLKKEVSLVESI